MAGGRPTKYKKEYCEQLVDHMAKGLSFETFAAICDINLDTLYEWAKVHPEFSEAKKRAAVKSRLKWEELGLSGTQGEIMNFNSGTWIFNMKNRFKWTDRMETKETQIPISVDDLLTEAKELIKNLEKGK